MTEQQGPIDKQTEGRHLLRSVKTALELAIVARAPADIVNRLGRVAGLLDATIQLSNDASPADASPANALMPELIADGQAAVERWEAWRRDRTPSA